MRSSMFDTLARYVLAAALVAVAVLFVVLGGDCLPVDQLPSWRDKRI
jgi:hypothetical protein